MTFHTFRMGDVDDVAIYAAQPIWEWQQTDQGRWVMEHAQDLVYHTNADPTAFGYRVYISGHLEPRHATEYLLKWTAVEYS